MPEKRQPPTPKGKTIPLTAEQLKELGIEVNEDQAKALNSKFESELESTVTGLKNKTSELLGNQKLLKEKLSQFEGLDIEKAREAIAKQQEMANKKLIAEGKLDELALQRTERMIEDYEKIPRTNKSGRTNQIICQ